MRVFIIIIVTLNLISCKETHCPAFPSNLIDYFPYSNGDEIKFENLNNDTLTIEITRKWVSDSYSFDWNCKCSCEADAGFDTDDANNYSIKIEGRIHFYNETNTSILSCNFYDAQVSSDNFEIEQIIKTPFSDQLIESFGDTVVMEKLDYYRIGNVRIIKGIGIVDFWDNKHNCKWTMIEKNVP